MKILWASPLPPVRSGVSDYAVELLGALGSRAQVRVVEPAGHFGLRVEPNTESLGKGTTASVVTSITVVILVDALFAIAFKDIGV